MPLASIPEAIDAIRRGQMIVVVDDEDRENEGDLTIAAQHVTPDVINFMATYGRGLICLAMSKDKCDQLGLKLMSPHNTSRYGTAFTESVDASEGVSTGISAADRALTIQISMKRDARPTDLSRPGHMFPLMAREGGVLVRAGQTEASVDLAVLAGLEPGGVICEIMNEDGTMARVPDLEIFCQKHQMLMVSVADLIRYRLKTERIIERCGEGIMQTAFGDFRVIAYGNRFDEERHIVMALGDFSDSRPTLVRMHSHCLLGNVFHSQDCDCDNLLRAAQKRIAEEGRGAIVYLHHNGPGLLHQNGSILLHGRDFSSFTGRDPQMAQSEAGVGAQILSDLGLHQIRLMSNRPRKYIALDAYGIEIAGVEPLAW